MTTIKITHEGKTQEIGFSESLEKANTFLVVGHGYYGYGETLQRARQNCLTAGAKPNDSMRAYLGDESLGVNGLGLVTARGCLFDLGNI